MENTTLIQLYSFLIYLISGMIIAIFFDTFRVLRKSFHTSDMITYIEDILFWLITGIFLLFVLFYVSNGEIRLYSIVALLLGAIFYMLTISKYFIHINVLIVTFFKKLLYQTYRILTYPIKLLLHMIRKLISPFTFFVINLKKTSFNFSRKMKKKEKKHHKKEKIARERRILKKNVEKYN